MPIPFTESRNEKPRESPLLFCMQSVSEYKDKARIEALNDEESLQKCGGEKEVGPKSFFLEQEINIVTKRNGNKITQHRTWFCTKRHINIMVAPKVNQERCIYNCTT